MSRSQNGIDHADSFKPPHGLSFDVDRALVEGGRTTARLFARTKGPTIAVDLLVVDPDVVLALIEFYRDHPEERAELRTVEWQDRVSRLRPGLEAAD